MKAMLIHIAEYIFYIYGKLSYEYPQTCPALQSGGSLSDHF